jgi:hypothetical protein
MSSIHLKLDDNSKDDRNFVDESNDPEILVEELEELGKEIAIELQRVAASKASELTPSDTIKHCINMINPFQKPINSPNVEDIVKMLIRHPENIAANLISRFPKSKSTQTESMTSNEIEHENVTIKLLEKSSCLICLNKLMETHAWCVKPCGHIICYNCGTSRLMTDKKKCVYYRHSSDGIRFPIESRHGKSDDEKKRINQVIHFTFKTKVKYSNKIMNDNTDIVDDIVLALRKPPKKGMMSTKGTEMDGFSAELTDISKLKNRIFKSKCLFCRTHQIDVNESLMSGCGYLVCGDRTGCEERQIMMGAIYDIATTMETGTCRGCYQDSSECGVFKLFPSGDNN